MYADEIAQSIKDSVNDNSYSVDFNEDLPLGKYVMILRELDVYEPDSIEKPEQAGHINGKFAWQVVCELDTNKTDWKNKMERHYPKLFKPELLENKEIDVKTGEEIGKRNLRIMAQSFMTHLNRLAPAYWEAKSKKDYLESGVETVYKFDSYSVLQKQCEECLNSYGSFRNDDGSYDYGMFYKVEWYERTNGEKSYRDFRIIGIAKSEDYS